jgi:hypothetical protein
MVSNNSVIDKLKKNNSSLKWTPYIAGDTTVNLALTIKKYKCDVESYIAIVCASNVIVYLYVSIKIILTVFALTIVKLAQERESEMH